MISCLRVGLQADLHCGRNRWNVPQQNRIGKKSYDHNGIGSLSTSFARERDKKIESAADTVGFLATVGVMAKNTSLQLWCMYLSDSAYLLMRRVGLLYSVISGGGGLSARPLTTLLARVLMRVVIVLSLLLPNQFCAYMLALRLRERNGEQCYYLTVDILMCYNRFVLAQS